MARQDRPRRVLMLCYYYPPLASAGTQRSVGFARWLRAHGWTPIVLTVRQSRIRWEPRCEDVPPDVDVVRSFEWDLQRLLTLLTGVLTRLRKWLRLSFRPGLLYTWCLPDIQMAWFSTLRGAWLARTCDCVYASCSPFSSALSACLIKRLTGRPVVLDFRDPWALNPHSPHTPMQRRILARLERWVIRVCDALILNTPGAERLYRERYPDHAHKMTCVPNGFDRLNPAEPARDGRRFTIMHAGDFYRSRTPARLLEALAELNDPDVEFVQLGPGSAVLDRYADRVRITQIDRVRHEDALARMRTASLLYLVQGWEEGVTDYVSVASKTYEYLATGLPILAEVPPGDNADIIRRYATCAWVVTEPSVEAVKRAVCAARAAARREPRIDPLFIDTFDRRRLTARLAAILDRVVAPGADGALSERRPHMELASDRPRGK